jgi:hypothetical protein
VIALVAGFFMHGRMGGMKTQISLFSQLLAAPLLLIAIGGCSPSRTQPANAASLASGVIESVTIWDKSVQRAGETGSNTGHPVPQGSRVEVYEQFILITPPDGPTALTPHGWYTDLKFKRDAALSVHCFWWVVFSACMIMAVCWYILSVMGKRRK